MSICIQSVYRMQNEVKYKKLKRKYTETHPYEFLRTPGIGKEPKYLEGKINKSLIKA